MIHEEQKCKIKAVAKVELTHNKQLVLSVGEKCTIIAIKTVCDKTLVRIKYKRKLFEPYIYYGMTNINNFII